MSSNKPFTPVTGGGGQQRGRMARPQINVPTMQQPPAPVPASSSAGQGQASPAPAPGPPSPTPSASSTDGNYPPIRPRSASLSRQSVPIQPGSASPRPVSIASIYDVAPPSAVRSGTAESSISSLNSPSLTLSRDTSTAAEPVTMSGSGAGAISQPIIIDVPPPRAPSPDINPAAGKSAIQPQNISFDGDQAPGATIAPSAVRTSTSASATIPTTSTPPVPSYKQRVPSGAPGQPSSGPPASPGATLAVPAGNATRPRGGRKGSNSTTPNVALVSPTSDPSSAIPRYAILDYSAEGGIGQYQVGATGASLKAYLSESAARGMGVGKGGGGKVGDSQQTARWVHCSYSSAEPRSEWAGIVKTIRNLGSFRGGKKVVGGRTFQKQTLTIDESGVSFSIPVYAEDANYSDFEGIELSASSKREESFGSTYTYIRPETTVLEALSRVEGRTLKRGRMECRIEFVRGWRVDDIRMLLLTVLSLRDPELENDLFADPMRAIMPTANVHNDGTALLGSVLRSVIEVMAEVVTFMEDAFADAEGVVFMKPAVVYQQVLTALKAEMLVVKRDLSVVENQIRALSGFLLGVAPPGSAWAGSVINVEAVANECVVLRERIDALLQRCDALVGLVNFEVTAYQNRTIFALTAVSMLFLPAGIYSEVMKMSPEHVIGDGSFRDWALGITALFFVTNIILFIWVSPTVVRDSLEELIEWDRDALTRSRRIFFKRLSALIAGRKQYAPAVGLDKDVDEHLTDDDDDDPALTQ